MGYRQEIYEQGTGRLLEVIDTRELEEEKSARIKRLRNECTMKIYEQAPIHKQMNAALGISSDSEALLIKNWILKCTEVMSQLESTIHAATDLESFDRIDCNFSDMFSSID